MESLNYPRPCIFRRSCWGASFGLGASNKTVRDLVVIHHTHVPATVPGDSLASVAELLRRIERFHAGEKGWKGIAYQWLVDQGGRIWEGRGWYFTGAHTARRNTRSIGIAGLIKGGHTAPTPAMIESIRWLIQKGKDLSVIHPDAAIRPHSDFSKTGCPGMRMKDWLPQMDPNGGWTDLSKLLIVDDRLRS